MGELKEYKGFAWEGYRLVPQTREIYQWNKDNEIIKDTSGEPIVTGIELVIKLRMEARPSTPEAIEHCGGLRSHKLGAEVTIFDLSPDNTMVEEAEEHAVRILSRLIDSVWELSSEEAVARHWPGTEYLDRAYIPMGGESCKN